MALLKAIEKTFLGAFLGKNTVTLYIYEHSKPKKCYIPLYMYIIFLQNIEVQNLFKQSVCLYIYVLLTGWEDRTGKIFCRGLENGQSRKAEGRF